MYYAQLNDQNVCIALSLLSGTVDAPNMTEIDSFDQDKLWRKYENGAWSTDKFEPVPVPYVDPLTTQVTELKSQNADIIFALVSNNLM